MMHYNMQPNSLLKSAPASVMFNRQFNDLTDYLSVKDQMDETSRLTNPRGDHTSIANEVRDIVIPALAEATRERRQKSQDQFNKKKKIVKFAIGSIVAFADPLHTAKMQPRYHGPYEVTHCTRGGSYTLRDFRTGEMVKGAFAPSQLKPVSDDPTYIERNTQDKDYVIEKILDHRIRKDGGVRIKEYLTRFEGYDHNADEWLPIENFNGTTLIDEYERTNAKQAKGKLQKAKAKASNKKQRSKL